MKKLLLLGLAIVFFASCTTRRCHSDAKCRWSVEKKHRYLVNFSKF